jgi:radical SAM protein with 4Fe4S-binding SPASM domain
MAVAPYLSINNLVRQFRAALLFKKTTGWKFFYNWAMTSAFKSIPAAAGAVGMGCIGYGYHAVWEVTEACNLRCRHCHATSDVGGPNELTTKEGFAFIDQLARLPRFQMLAYSGGEPMVRPDIEDLLAYSNKRGIVNIIASNGTLIDLSRARELKRLGVKGIAVGFDSTDPAIHNHIRQNPTAFDRALRGIEACKRAGMILQINYTAMQENIATLDEVVRFCHDIHADIMLCYQLVPMGRGMSIHQSALSPADNQRLVQKLRALQQHAVTIVEPVAAPQYWAHLLNRDNLEQKPLAKGNRFHGCAAGWGLIYLKPDGEVWSCPFIPISGGNVRNRPLLDIWTNSRIFKDLSDRNLLKGKCGQCDNRNICGGCRGKAFAATGDALAEDPSCYLHHQEMPDYLGWQKAVIDHEDDLDVRKTEAPCETV